MEKKWKILKSRKALDEEWFRVDSETVELPDKRRIDDYYVWNSGDVVLVVPYTKNKKFVLVKQYKHGIKEVVIEFPAGVLEKDEDPKIGAEREYLEETGHVSKDVELIATLSDNPTKQRGKGYVFLARDSEKKLEQKLDEFEDIEILEVDKDELLSMIEKGEIWISGTIAAAFIALRKLDIL
ncbi:MAG: NUDIX domain-containing protein [Nanoarchaeota archaeon]